MPRKTTFIAGYIWGHHKTENLLEFMDLQTNNIDEPNRTQKHTHSK